jgi:hypothetical protein
MLTFLEDSIFFSKVVVLTYIPTSSVGRFFFPSIFPTFAGGGVPDGSNGEVLFLIGPVCICH